MEDIFFILIIDFRVRKTRETLIENMRETKKRIEREKPTKARKLTRNTNKREINIPLLVEPISQQITYRTHYRG